MPTRLRINLTGAIVFGVAVLAITAYFAMYWEVMNCVRQKPWMPCFIIHEVYKRRY